MLKYRIDGKSLADWDKFHDFFEKTFDFPDYYGRNMDAWNDCMSDFCDSNGPVSLHIENISEVKSRNPEAYNALIECSAFINWRSTNNGGDPLMVLSFYI